MESTTESGLKLGSVQSRADVPALGERLFGLVVEICYDHGKSRPRVRPIEGSSAPTWMRVEFPRALRKGRAEGSRFILNAHVAQNHRADGRPYGRSYLIANNQSIELLD